MLAALFWFPWIYSTANLLLHPFGLSVDHATPLSGALVPPEGWPAITVDSACEVKGVGKATATVWTCDLTHRYIDINGSYRS